MLPCGCIVANQQSTMTPSCGLPPPCATLPSMPHLRLLLLSFACLWCCGHSFRFRYDDVYPYSSETYRSEYQLSNIPDESRASSDCRYQRTSYVEQLFQAILQTEGDDVTDPYSEIQGSPTQREPGKSREKRPSKYMVCKRLILWCIRVSWSLTMEY